MGWITVVILLTTNGSERFLIVVQPDIITGDYYYVIHELQCIPMPCFQQRNIRGGDWIGKFNHTTKTYESINSTNFIRSLKVVNDIVDRYQNNPTVIGIEPSNLL